ncbi:MAG: septum formation initiator family protein [Veillonellaceae bacterium]|nr:septum formation initiator family protein [Veillonellaceae bacterium]
MLAREAGNWQMKDAVARTGARTKVKKRRVRFLSDVTPELRHSISLIMLAAFLMLIFLILQSINTRAGYGVVKDQQTLLQATKTNEQLQLDVAQLKSPERIEEIAQKKLGMVMPNTFVYNSQGTTVERSKNVTKHIVD